jgi:hypothetical protein
MHPCCPGFGWYDPKGHLTQGKTPFLDQKPGWQSSKKNVLVADFSDNACGKFNQRSAAF